MQQGPWAKYAQQQPAAPAVVGVPRRDPYKERDQQLQEEAAARAREDQEFQRQKFQAEMAQRQKEQTSDPKLVEAERTAAFLATRIKGGIDDISRALRGDPNAAKPTVVGQVAGLLGEDARGAVNSPGRRQVEDAQIDILDAALTLGTGAAYAREQLEGYRESYFPSLTDDPQTIAAKNLRLRRLLEAARVKAGNAAPMIDQALATIGGAGDMPDDQVTDELRQRIARGDNPAATIQWLISIGRAPDEDTINRIIANAGNSNPDVRPVESDASRGFQEGLGGVAEGVGDVLGLVSNPFLQIVNKVAGTNYNPDMGENLREAVGLPEASSPEQQFINSVGGGALMGGGFAGAGRAAAPYVGQAVQGALRSLGAAPVVDTVAGGASGGSAELARQAGAGPGGQMLAALAGGAASIPAATRAGRMISPTGPAETALTRAGRAEGVTVNRAMVDPSVQNRVTGTEASLAGGPIIRKNMGKVSDQIEGRVNALGQGGHAMEPNAAGQTVQGAMERSIKTSGQKFNRQYDVLEKAAGGVKVAPTKSLETVDGVIAKLSELPENNKAEIAFLNGLKKDFQKDLSVGALRRLRTSLRKKISKGELTFGEDEAAVLSIMDAASSDIATGLAAAGKRGVAEQFKSVDKAYRQRMEFIRGEVQKVIGKRGANLSPEQVFANLKAMASPKGNADGLGRIMRELDPEERSDIAMTFADALGKNAKGEFSTAHLVSQAQKLPRAARVHIFGEEGAQSLDNLITLAKEHSRVVGGLNSSKTGATNDYRSWLTNLIFGAGSGIITQSGTTGVAAAAGGMAAKSARDIISARVVMSPKVSKWLATAPRTASPKAIDDHYARLKALVAREPALSAEIEQIAQVMTRAANENVTPGLAAENGNTADERK